MLEILGTNLSFIALILAKWFLSTDAHVFWGAEYCIRNRNVFCVLKTCVVFFQRDFCLLMTICSLIALCISRSQNIKSFQVHRGATVIHQEKLLMVMDLPCFSFPHMLNVCIMKFSLLNFRTLLFYSLHSFSLLFRISVSDFS